MLKNMSEDIKKKTKKQKLREDLIYYLKNPQAILRAKLKWREVLHTAFCRFKGTGEHGYCWQLLLILSGLRSFSEIPGEESDEKVRSQTGNFWY